MVEAIAQDPGIELVENALALDLITDVTGAAQGITLHVMGTGQRDGVGAALAPAVVLATGGFGQVFRQTTNPYVSTGDGVALAMRAGADVADLEFVQFHPTVMWLGPFAQGQQPLVSEAVRGEGAYLIDGDPRLNVPRRSEPRSRVPAGSVALAGHFSGVYPRDSPGGWQLIGRTDAALWDINRAQPALLTPGTWVQFRAGAAR